MSLSVVNAPGETRTAPPGVSPSVLILRCTSGAQWNPQRTAMFRFASTSPTSSLCMPRTLKPSTGTKYIVSGIAVYKTTCGMFLNASYTRRMWRISLSRSMYSPFVRTKSMPAPSARMPGTFCVPLSRYSGISRGWSSSNARVPVPPCIRLSSFSPFFVMSIPVPIGPYSPLCPAQQR